jgi:hypothetical protein
VILVRFAKPVLDEQVDNVRVCLDQTGNIRVFRCFRYTHPPGGVLELQLDFICVTKYFSEQRVTHVNRTPLFDATVHGLNVLSNLCRDLRILRLGQGLHPVLDFRHCAVDLIVVLQQKMEIVPVLHESGIGSTTAASATSETATTAVAPSTLCLQLAGQERHQT